jgi:hypothetical protein
MTTRHLNVSLTCYGDGEWSVALLETVCVPGRPARRELLELRTGDSSECLRRARQALERMIMVEEERVRNAGSPQ